MIRTLFAIFLISTASSEASLRFVDPCGNAVSVDQLISTEVCIEKCKALGPESDHFRDHCLLGKPPSSSWLWAVIFVFSASYEIINGRVVIPDDESCLSNSIFGYSNGEQADFRGPNINDITSSVGECQQLCQTTEGCAAFQWNAIRDGNYLVGSCTLKNEAQVIDNLEDIQNEASVFQVAHAFAQEVEVGISIDTKYCNSEMPRVCGSLYKCHKCDAKQSCVWESTNHATGPKHCKKR